MDKLDKATILQAFRREEQNRQRQSSESLNWAKAGKSGAQRPKDGICHYCKKPGHWKSECLALKNKANKTSQSEGAKVADEEKAAVTTVLADQASSNSVE